MTTKTEPGSGDGHEHHAESAATPNDNSARAETKPLTILLPEDTLKKLRVISIVRETSVSELVAEAAAGVVRKELKKALAKISGE